MLKEYGDNSESPTQQNIKQYIIVYNYNNKICTNMVDTYAWKSLRC